MFRSSMDERADICYWYCYCLSLVCGYSVFLLCCTPLNPDTIFPVSAAVKFRLD